MVLLEAMEVRQIISVQKNISIWMDTPLIYMTALRMIVVFQYMEKLQQDLN